MLEFLSKVDDVRKYICKLVDNNEIMFKYLQKMQQDYDKENKVTGTGLNNSKSNNFINLDQQNLRDSYSGLKNSQINNNINSDSYISKTPLSKSNNNISKSSNYNANNMNNNFNMNNMYSINNNVIASIMALRPQSQGPLTLR